MSNAKIGGFADTLLVENKNENSKNISGVSKKTCIFDLVEKKDGGKKAFFSVF